MTGTNTEVGKTYVSALLARAFVSRRLRVGVYKPVASGCVRDGDRLYSEDAEQLWLAADKPLTMEDVTPQCFAAAVAPNVAARMVGTSVDAKLLRSGLDAWRDFDVTLVEGVGGLMSPVSDEDLVVDLACEFGFPLIVVVANELGCINHTLQTLEVARQRGLTVAGLILNSASPTQDVSCETNQQEIARWSDVRILACVRWGDTELEFDSLNLTL